MRYCSLRCYQRNADRPIAKWSISHHPTIATLFLLGAIRCAAATPETEPPGKLLLGESPLLQQLQGNRPFLILRDNDLRQLRTRIDRDPLLQGWVTALRKNADAILLEPLPRHELPDGLRLLATSRQVLHRAYTLAFLYRLEGDRRYLDRLAKDLETAAAFPDWNPKHFLDTAEMTHAFAIAYDWLYDSWTEDQRRILREAIVNHGLRPGLRCYTGEDPRNWWCSTVFNWNQVCNSGLLLGAIAVSQDEPELAEQVISHALHSLPLAFGEFAPDGACREGPSYWSYACDYTIVGVAALQSAFGTDFGLTNYEGFDGTAMYLPQMTGPTGNLFNFADCAETNSWSTAPMFWLANRFHLDAVNRMAIAHVRPTSLDILWYRSSGPDEQPLPTATRWRGAEAMSMRTGWDSAATWVAFKAGCPQVNHAQADLGSFVLEAQGQRWAIDLGKDDYNLPGYFEIDQRWNFYRNRAEGHNTIVINPDKLADQVPSADVKIARPCFLNPHRQWHAE